MTDPCGQLARSAIIRAGAAAVLAVAGCSGIERTDKPPQPRRVDVAQVEVPPILQGTIAAETVLDGYEPVVVHGYGLVVGLDGTGSADVPPDVRQYLLSLAARHGIGSESSGWRALSPEALLDSSDTAVVIVEGLIPPGAAADTQFDVRVFAYPTSSTTSLEGGRLYSMDLVPAVRSDIGRRVLPPSGSRQPAALATASGPIFINPFADPGAVRRDDIDRRTGLIMHGGQATKDMPLKLRLMTPSHGRAAAIQATLNSRFVQEPGQRDPTARGVSAESVVITVPPSYRQDTPTFVELVRHMTIRQAGAERVAATIRGYILENPAAARAASWRWEAIGPRSLDVIRDLYAAPQELPRLAALRAGAYMDDPLVTTHLLDMAESGSPEFRRQAILLLGEMGLDPRVDQTLRGLLNHQDVETRLEAYDALADRGDPSVQRVQVGGRFVLDIVESNVPMIYITQLGMPRIAVFNPRLAVTRPATVSAWSGRFMVLGEADAPELEVYYRPPHTTNGASFQVNADVVDLIEFLGRSTEPDNPLPGLGFSYGQVIGVLHQIWRQGYLKADFRPEQDRILAAILRQQVRGLVTERPEFDTDVGTPETPAGDAPQPPPSDAPGESSGSSRGPDR